jgi:predicted aldo/keto reductase-like oxidoreductase
MFMEHLNRRHFLKTGATAMAAGLVSQTARPLLAAAEPEVPKGKINLEYRTLGKTDLKITTVAYGAMRTTDPAVLERALDLGINLVDTAHVYQGGNNEVMVGNVLKKRRKDAFLCTKIKPDNKKGMTRLFETSLKRLQMEYVDILYLHSVSQIDQIHDEAAMELFAQWKKAGKVRFIGFSTHSNEAELVQQASLDKFWDVILVAYNFKKEPALTEAIHQAAAAGIGIVGMKTQAGGYDTKALGNLSPHQAALKWVLQNPSVHTTIPSMTTFAELEEDVQVMGHKMGWRDRETLERYGQLIDQEYCRSCGACRESCPHGVNIPEINRCYMYLAGYRDFNLARTNYQELAPEIRQACADCGTCVAQCKYGIQLSQRMPQINQMFA